MKVSLLNVVMFGTGVVLLYSGIKGYDPRDVLRWGLGGKKPKPMTSGTTVKPRVPDGEYPGDIGIPDPSRENDVPA